ncbi:MAG TPA: hypothetical protein VF610_00170 [Segetibacter sp.]
MTLINKRCTDLHADLLSGIAFETEELKNYFMATSNQMPQSGEQVNQPFETDSQKLTNRHLADPNHVISDEEFQSIRVGMTPPPDDATQQAVSEFEDKIADKKSDSDNDIIPGAQKSTPWDVID